MKYKESKYNQYYYMYGKHTCLNAINNSHRHIDNIYLTEENWKLYHTQLTDLPYKIVTRHELEKLLPPHAVHQNICARVKPLASIPLEAFNFHKPNITFALLEHIHDPQNLGAIIRTASAFGIDGIILPKENSVTENAVVAKAASGALEHVPLFKVTNVSATIKFLKKQSFWIIGFDGHNDQTLDSKHLQNNVCLILGSEGKGLRRLTKDNCDLILKIPMHPQMESLNVSNAAAIIFYESYKNRII